MRNAPANNLPMPTESEEQQALFQWASIQAGRYPELALLYHIPNEGKRSRATGGRMRAEGLKPGVPDICLPVARGKSHGLYIELKRRMRSRTTTEQMEWLEALAAQGYVAAVCKGWQEAADMIMRYLREGDD